MNTTEIWTTRKHRFIRPSFLQVQVQVDIAKSGPEPSPVPDPVSPKAECAISPACNEGTDLAEAASAGEALRLRSTLTLLSTVLAAD